MFHFVYILKCSDNTLYTGYTTDISRRIDEHNTSKKAATYTRGRRPVVLVYSETYSTRREALQREAEIKKLPKTQKMALYQAI